MTVSDEEVSNEDGCLSRNMTINTCNKIEAESFDYQCVTLQVPLTPDKDSIDKEQLMKMPKRATLTNAARPDRVHETRDARGSQCENSLLLPLRRATA